MSDIDDEEIPQEKVKIENKRIFINHVDTYNGKNLAKFLSKCVVGASVDGNEEEGNGGENEEEQGEGNQAKKEPNYYRIYGTLKNLEENNKKQLTHVREIIKTDNKEEMLEQLMECDVIVYDIINDLEQVDEACWAISVLHSQLEKIDKPKIFILLSTCMTWAKTKPSDPVSSFYFFKFLKLSQFYKILKILRKILICRLQKKTFAKESLIQTIKII
jgi:adenylate kinase